MDTDKIHIVPVEGEWAVKKNPSSGPIISKHEDLSTAVTAGQVLAEGDEASIVIHPVRAAPKEEDKEETLQG